MVITGLTRNFTAAWSFRPPEILDIKGFSKLKIEYFSVFSPAFLSKNFLSIKQTEIYGDVPKWLKGPHSKCGRSGVPRRKSSNLFISATISEQSSLCSDILLCSSLFTSFSNIPLACKITAYRQGKSCFHSLRRGDFRTVIKVRIDICRCGKIAVPEPLLNVLEWYAVCKQ